MKRLFYKHKKLMEKWLELKMMKADSEPYEKSNKRGRARRSIKGKNLSL